MTRRSPRTWGLALAGSVLLCGLATHYVVPMLIRATHAGQLPGLGRLMPGRTHSPVDGYLQVWEPLGRTVTATVATIALLVALGLLLRGQARRLAREPGTAPAMRTGGLILVACWLGILFGLGEAWYIMQRVFYRGQVIPGDLVNASQHAVWMAPVAGLIALGGAGILGALVHRLAPTRISARGVVLLLAALGLFGTAMATGRLHWAAAAILALGLTTRLRNAVSPGAGELVTAARRSIGWLLVLLTGLGALVVLGEWRREQRQLATAGPAPAGAPNVLFIVLDTERAASTSLHGYTRETTPFLQELAGRGVWFERAISPSSWTLPSHAAMFTGKRIRDLNVDGTHPLALRHLTVAEVLADRGYATAGFVANHYYGSDVFGLDQGFGRWEDQPVLPGIVLKHGWLSRGVTKWIRNRLGNHRELGRKHAAMVNASFLAWLDRPSGRPFFVFLNYFDSHGPYRPPPPYDVLFSDVPPQYWLHKGTDASAYSATELAELQLAYATGIAYLDDQLRQLFAALEARGVLDGTLVIITSDHGEVFGENGKMDHGQDLALPLVHVPLVILPPRFAGQGLRITTPVELRHLPATILDLTGGIDSRLLGTSLAPAWTGQGDIPPGPSLAEFGSMTAVVTDTHQLIASPAAPPRLFNHREDPLGLINLANQPAHAALVDSLLRALREATGKP